MHGYLADDVSRPSKAVNPEPLHILTGHSIGAVPDEPGTQQRRGGGIIISRSQSEALPSVRDSVFSITPVESVTGELGTVAEVFPAGSAEMALPAGVADPRHSYPVADLK